MDSVKYKCDSCNCTFHNKSNYNRHLKSVAHSKSTLTVNTVNTIDLKKKSEYVCNNCNNKFSCRQSLSRHKLHYCSIKKGNVNTDQDLKEQMAFICNKLEKVEKELSECKNQLVASSTTNNNTNCHNTYNISVKNYIQKNYPNAPALKGITDYSKLVYKDFKLMDTLVYNFINKNLHKYLGNFIIGHYKKKNPAEQSLWSSDVSRLTYLVSVLLKDDKSIWNHDYKGARIKESVVTPLLNYVRDCIDEFWENIEVKKPNINDLHGIEEQHIYRNNVAKMAELIDNNILCDDILKYIAPFFCIDKKDMDSKMIESAKPDVKYFVDTD